MFPVQLGNNRPGSLGGLRELGAGSVSSSEEEWVAFAGLNTTAFRDGFDDRRVKSAVHPCLFCGSAL